MTMISAAEAAKKWNVSLRTVQQMCADGRVSGARQFAGSWQIPEDCPRPPDGRSLRWKQGAQDFRPMPRRAPLLCMTDLYHTPGTAEKVSRSLRGHPEARELFDAGIAYSRGEIDQVYQYAQNFLNKEIGYYAVSGSSFLLLMCAIWRGDLELWTEARQQLYSTPCQNETDREILRLALAAADSSVFDHSSFPDWFEAGNFELLPPDSHPIAKIFYARYLYTVAYSLATGAMTVKGLQGLALMGVLGKILEPMITQAVVDKTVIPEIHLRLWCAAVYQNSGRDEAAIGHMDRAIGLALPDRLYGILAEYWRPLGKLLSQRLAIVDPAAEKAVRELHQTFFIGQSRLDSYLRNRSIATNLTQREQEVAKLAAFRLTNKQIARRLEIRESTVKTTIQNIMQKTGLRDRDEFGSIL